MAEISTASPESPDILSIKPDSTPPNRISAYYTLVFPNFTYYLQTLSVTIGRRCIPIATASSSDNSQVDVDLGPLKSVSRLHAKIEYEEDEERFVLAVIGRNGAWVDGVWSGSGSRVTLSERSQIQIASRTFHFVLPPPHAPEDAPSPSSQSSANRPRSPSVDITSISPPSSMPSHSPPPTTLPPTLPKIPPLPEPSLPDSNNIAKSKSNPKKRKKSDVDLIEMPKPEDMPPKPQLTYAQLVYRAIKALGGQATLQEIHHWIPEAYAWYKYNRKTGWENSVRHNLSSSRAFKKGERCAGERGKGFFWSVDEEFERTFQEQEAKMQAGVSQVNGSGKEGKSSRKKDKAGTSPLEPALKRSVKGDVKGTPLPPPLTSAPLAKKTPALSVSGPTPTHPSDLLNPVSSISVKSEHSTPPNPYASVTSTNWPPPPSVTSMNPATHIPPTQPTVSPRDATASIYVPIVIGPVPTFQTVPSHSTDLAAANPSSTPPQRSQPISLHNNTLYLNPDVFAHLTPDQVKGLETLGAQKALEILQGYIAAFLKEKMKTDAGRGKGTRGRGRPKRGRGGASGSVGKGAGVMNAGGVGKVGPSSGPFTTTPLPPRNVQPQLNHEGGEGRLKHTPANGIVPVFVDVKPPVPVPVRMTESGGGGEHSASPIIVVDDSDVDEDGRAIKKRKVDGATGVVG